MGAPGYVVFCENGHIVKNVAHHCIDFSVVESCKFCGSDRFYTEWEWGDPDYGESIIPMEPIDFIPVKLVFEKQETVINRYGIPVYDVSKVKKWKTTHL